MIRPGRSRRSLEGEGRDGVLGRRRIMGVIIEVVDDDDVADDGGDDDVDDK